MHISIPVESTIELLNFTPINPLISKCEIKVCYVGDDPNRNHSIITKAVATDMAKSLPGSPIVGFYNKETGDFEEHNRMIDVSNGKFNVIDTTRPYGFVDLGAKVWFQKFLDDGIEHEYLMTEGYVWSDIYPEAKRITEKGNNQSMELHNKLTKGTWTTDDNGMPKFFIINEAIISKLCILGENVEPCFEGAGIAAQFSIDGDFKATLYSMIEELKTALQEGGATHMENNENIMLDNENQETEIVLDNQEGEFKKKSDEEEDEEEKNEKKPPFPPKKDDESDDEESDDDEDEKKKKKMKHSKEEEEDEDECPDCGKPKSECTCEEDKKKKYNLEEIPEYVELAKNYAAVVAERDALEAEIKPLREFKIAADKKEKENMINSFYMLSDEDKADVVANIDSYSLDDIEAKLAILCVRNKVSFSLDEDNNEEEESKAPFVYNVTAEEGNDNAPAWIKAVRDTAKNMI